MAKTTTAFSRDLIRADAEDDKEKREDASAGTELRSTIPDSALADMTKCMDAVMDSLKGLHKRMDSMEEERKADKARKDAEEEEREEKAKADGRRKDEAEEPGKPEEVAADKRKDNAEDVTETKASQDSRKDESEEKKEEAHADSVSALKAEIAALKRQVAEVAPLVQRPMDEDQAGKLADAWNRADAVFSAFGSKAPNPLPNEDPVAYERRVVRELKSHSPRFRDVNLHAVADSTAFTVIRDGVYADALDVARSPASVPAGQLRAVTRTSGGHTFIEHHGSSRSWMEPIANRVSQAVAEIHGQ